MPAGHGGDEDEDVVDNGGVVDRDVEVDARGDSVVGGDGEEVDDHNDEQEDTRDVEVAYDGVAVARGEGEVHGSGMEDRDGAVVVRDGVETHRDEEAAVGDGEAGASGASSPPADGHLAYHLQLPSSLITDG